MRKAQLVQLAHRVLLVPMAVKVWKAQRVLKAHRVLLVAMAVKVWKAQLVHRALKAHKA